MSDLQCPARFVLVSAPDASTAQSLRHDRVAAVPPAPVEPRAQPPAAGHADERAAAMQDADGGVAELGEGIELALGVGDDHGGDRIAGTGG